MSLERVMTRRDFVNGVLAGAGSRLLAASAPKDWDGPGGAGDYARSHGNSWRVLEAAHRIRDGRYSGAVDATDTREEFALVIVGGGMSGLGAALHFGRKRKPEQTCLILDNHPVFGGESKQNEFVVDGQRLMGPQGANEFDIPADAKSDAWDLFEQLRIPRRFEYQEWSSAHRALEFDRTNYGFHHWIHAPSFGHFAGDAWVRDFWRSPHVSPQLKKWKYTRERFYPGQDYRRWLDTMTYQQFIESAMGLPKDVTAFADPILAAAVGLGCDALSAYAAMQVGLPGFRGFQGGEGFPIEFDRVPENEWHMFPGGNSGFARYVVKTLIPDAIEGDHELSRVLGQRIRFHRLDRRGSPFRLRLGATVVGVEQDGERVRVTYEKNGKLRRVTARAAVMAGGSWTTRHIVKDLPSEKREAFGQFLHSAVLVFNVAVRNWRFLYDRGLTAAQWREGFGFSCNVRRMMVFDGYRPKLDPDAPTVLTFYVPLYYPGLPAREQGSKGRQEMLATPFAGYEEKLRGQMRRMFGQPAEDAIAGIILNRWGHAYVNPTPGFYFGREGRPAAPDVIRRPLGRIAFAHSELFGHQFWLGAIREGRRAVDQLMGA